MQETLDKIYELTDDLVQQLLPYNGPLIEAGFKPVKIQGISELIKSADLIEQIRTTK